MGMMIHGIPVTADPSLSREKITKIVAELVRASDWEGRELGKIELISDGSLIHVCSYAKPSIQILPNE